MPNQSEKIWFDRTRHGSLFFHVYCIWNLYWDVFLMFANLFKFKCWDAMYMKFFVNLQKTQNLERKIYIRRTFQVVGFEAMFNPTFAPSELWCVTRFQLTASWFFFCWTRLKGIIHSKYTRTLAVNCILWWRFSSILNKIEWDNTFHVYTSKNCQLYFMLKFLFSNHYSIPCSKISRVQLWTASQVYIFS